MEIYVNQDLMLVIKRSRSRPGCYIIPLYLIHIPFDCGYSDGKCNDEGADIFAGGDDVYVIFSDRERQEYCVHSQI